MDPKKQQNLTPELKQIYERVMNTQVKKDTPQASATPQPATTTTTPPPASPTTPPENTAPATPQTPQAPAQNEAFLSSVPPRPITDSSKPFVFTGKAPKPEEHAQQPSGSPTATPTKSKKISTPIIVVLVVVLVIVWGVFWAKLLGLF